MRSIGYIVLTLTLVTLNRVHAQQLYWADIGTDQQKIYRSDADGENARVLATRVVFPSNVVVDEAGRKLYWIDQNLDRIERADLDGSGVEVVVSELVNDIALDGAGHIYWTSLTFDEIRRANLDGTGVVTLVSGTPAPFGIELDLVNGKMYWSDTATDRLYRSNLDGSEVEVLRTEVVFPTSVSIDPVARELYWTDTNLDTVKRFDLDGTGVEDVLSGLSFPGDVAIDQPGGSIYWTDASADAIFRANLDGSQPVVLVADGSGGIDLVTPAGIVVDPVAGRMYWGDTGSDTIYAANLDGTGIMLVAAGADARCLILDDAGEFLYWGDVATDSVRRVRVDGTELDTVVSGIPLSTFVLDTAASKLVFASGGTIRRINADGSGLQTLFTSQGSVQWLEIDPVERRLYWSDSSGRRLVRGSADGGAETVEELTVQGPRHLLVDVPSGSIYWSDYSRGVQRANLDGSSIEQVLPTDRDPDGFAVDFDNRDVYWAENSTIFRRDLDGGPIMQLITGQSAPAGVDLDLDPVDGGFVYWTDTSARRVRRATLDGTFIEDLTIGIPDDVEVDRENGRVYWNEPGDQKIQSASIDGGAIRPLIDDIYPTGFVIDRAANRVIWIDADVGRLYSRGLSGGSIQQLASGLDDPTSIDLDESRRTVYIVESGRPAIRSFDLDAGTLGTVPLPNLRYPLGIAIDEQAGILYWGEASSLVGNALFAANLDGSSVRQVVSSPRSPREITLDPNAQKIYWTVSGLFGADPEIRRVNPDGSGLETVVDDLLAFPNGIDLDVDPLSCLAGSVDASVGGPEDVLYLNGATGGKCRIVSVPEGGLLWATLLAPPAGGSGRFVVHANAGYPNAGTEVSLPSGVGRACFDFLLQRGAAPLAIWDNTGKSNVIGESRYFDGSMIPDPAPAPSTFLQLFDGDTVNLPVGTVVTFQAVVLDPTSPSRYGASVSNALSLRIL